MPGRRRNPLKRDEKIVKYFLGRWKVENSFFDRYDNNSDDSNDSDGEDSISQRHAHTIKLLTDFIEDMNGVQFTLDEQYDITWYVPTGRRNNPLFSTNAFDLDEEELELMGGVDGTSYVFVIVPLEDTVHLKCPASPTITLVLVLKKINEDSHCKFSLLDSLEQGYFSDLNIRSTDGQQFPVHLSVLSAACLGVKHREWEMILSTLSTKAVRASLHYIYTSVLPANITEEIAREILDMTAKNDKMVYLKDLCSVHIESYRLKKRLLELVDGILQSLDVARQLIEATDMSDPPKTLYAIKQLAREAAIAISKFALLCQLYTTNKQKMTKKEKREVLEYVQARIVVCLDQGRELLQLVLAKWEGLTVEQKEEAAGYIIPEVERIWGLLNTHAAEVHDTVSKISKKNKSVAIGGLPEMGWKASAALQFSTKLKDIKRLKKLNEEFENFVKVGTDKRQWFIELTEEEKVDRILRAIQELSQDGEEIIDKFEEAKKKILLANALDWNSYKLAISIGCSYMSWSVNKLLHLKSSIKPILKTACKFIGSEEVNSTLVYLSLLDPSDLASLTDDTQPAPLPLLLTLGGEHSLCPINQLAIGCHNLLESQDMCDMQFIVIDPLTPLSTDPTLNTDNPLAKEPIENGSVIKAHRVVLAARSEWFKRALQSGMIEDRDRRIVVQDIEESLFRTFLEYIYGKPLDFNEMKIQELIELLAVADRYETLSLRRVCENQLVSRVSDVNVFQLLTQAEQFSVRQLREATLNHILANPNVVMTQIDSYSDLPSDLKQEVRLILSGTQQEISKSFNTRTPTLSEAVLMGEPVLDLNRDIPDSSSESDNGSDIPSVIITDTNMLSVVEDNAVIMVSALKSVRNVVGEEATDDELKSFLLAADMNVNRAVNYYFGIEEEEM